MCSVSKYVRGPILSRQLAYHILAANFAYAVRYLPPPRLIP